MKKFFTFFGSMALLGAMSANAETISIELEDYDENPVASAVDAELTKTEDGTYVIENFLNSSAPLQFTFEEPAVNDYADITFVGNVVKNGEYVWPKTAEGNYVTYWLNDYNGNEFPTPVYDAYVVEGSYSAVYRYDLGEEDSEYEYYAYICFCGDGDEEEYDYFYAGFEFNDPDKSGVEAVNVTEGKAEFFNLNGQKVANPSNGIYVMKMGNKATKVMIGK